jgi:hypothetical protein
VSEYKSAQSASYCMSVTHVMCYSVCVWRILSLLHLLHSRVCIPHMCLQCSNGLYACCADVSGIAPVPLTREDYRSLFDLLNQMAEDKSIDPELEAPILDA